MALQVTTKVNGELKQFLCEPSETALHVLREKLGLTGTKNGCATGDCGACSVLLNDKLVCSCLVLGAELEGQELTTVEGVAEVSKLHPIQEKLLELGGLQCGICTPGIVISAKALLAENPTPSEEQVRYALAGNLCRCTGYDKIIRSILAAAEELAQTAEM